MARRHSKRPYGAGHIPLDVSRLASMPRTQTGPGGAEFTVRRVWAVREYFRIFLGDLL